VRASVGVQRQYTGTAGRIENSQVAVYLAYAAPTRHALIDRALYLPQSWTERPDRCADAGIPAGTEFATKPALATAMITAALDAGTPASWVAGDEVYGADPTLRTTLEGRGVGYVLAVASNRRVPTANGPLQVDFLATALPPGRGNGCTPVPVPTATGCTPGRGYRSTLRRRASLGVVAPQRHHR
jgi:SRSO17 transposase